MTKPSYLKTHSVFWIITISAILATAIWLSAIHLFFKPKLNTIYKKDGIPTKAVAMAARHLQLWSNEKARTGEINTMRKSNAEWDFMGRTFLVMALSEMCVREPDGQTDYLPVIDAVIDETIRLEQQNGMYFFLMPYAKARPFVEPPASLFIDSEIAMMLASRRIVAEKAEYKALLTPRIDSMVQRLEQNPDMAVESYPDECWLFDHSMALAAIRLSDYLDGTDHSSLRTHWLNVAKSKLIDPKSGLLISSFTTKAAPLDGPEGSSIWLSLHCLRLVDESFAKEQYQLARKELKRNLCGFAWSREWPVSWQGVRDIDAGAVIPILDVSAGGSGLAFVAAASFDDIDYLQQLHTTLDFAAFPEKKNGALRYCASNQVGDSVMLYSMVLGGIWNKVIKGHR